MSTAVPGALRSKQPIRGSGAPRFVARHFTRKAFAHSVKKTPTITKLVLVILAVLALVNLFRGRDPRLWMLLLMDVAPLFVVVPSRGWPRALVSAAAADLFRERISQPTKIGTVRNAMYEFLHRWAGVCALAGWTCAAVLFITAFCYFFDWMRPLYDYYLLLFVSGLLFLNLSVSAYCFARSKETCGTTAFGAIHGASVLLAVYAVVSLFRHGDNLASANATGAMGLVTLLSSYLYWAGWNVDKISEDVLLTRICAVGPVSQVSNVNRSCKC